jgi:GAF domain-containing protein
MADRFDIAAALAEAAREMNTARGTGATLSGIVEAARVAIPGIDHAGVTLAHRDGRVETRAWTDQMVCELDALQYELGEGPCLEAIRDEPLVVVEHARHEQRWPRFIPRALPLGLRSMMGIRLFADEQTLGALNLYGTTHDTFGADVEPIAELFATHAATALGHARREDGLNTALATRKVIGQALGIVMERFSLDQDRAFEYLTRVSSHGNVKLRDVATRIVEDREEQTRAGSNGRIPVGDATPGHESTDSPAPA